MGPSFTVESPSRYYVVLTMLTNGDLSKVVHLLGEIAVLDDDFQSKKKFLMSGLCQLVEAKSWVWALGSWSEENAAPAYSGFLHGGFSYEEFSSLMATVEHPDNESLCAAWVEEIAQSGQLVTASLSDLDTEGLVESGPLKALIESAGIGDAIISGVAQTHCAMSSFGFYRGLEQEAFTLRDKLLIDMVLKAVGWLHHTGWEEVPEQEIETLYPQYKKVLGLLLEGIGKKEIAKVMGLSESTVATYMKEVYKYYDVNSQVLLMRKLNVKNSSEI